jgi:hypothetical protein
MKKLYIIALLGLLIPSISQATLYDYYSGLKSSAVGSSGSPAAGADGAAGVTGKYIKIKI